MVYIIILTLTIILFKGVFKINIKNIKKLKENEKLSKITEKFPEDIIIAKEILEILNNTDVKIEQAKDTSTSLYIAILNKISIADMKNNYSRIQTIAHECIHSIQDRCLLLFNFIFSNINIIYFLIISILTIFRVITNTNVQIFILLLFGGIQFSVRSFLEIDAMIKSKFLAKDYIEKKNICTEEEKNELLEEYDKINKVGIPFVIDNLLTGILIKIIIYAIIMVLI